MKIKPVSSKKKLLYSVGVLCASLTSCDDTPQRNQPTHQDVPESVPSENPSAQPEEVPQLLGGDVPYIPDPEDEQHEQNSPSAN